HPSENTHQVAPEIHLLHDVAVRQLHVGGRRGTACAEQKNRGRQSEGPADDVSSVHATNLRVVPPAWNWEEGVWGNAFSGGTAGFSDIKPKHTFGHCEKYRIAFMNASTK